MQKIYFIFILVLTIVSCSSDNSVEDVQSEPNQPGYQRVNLQADFDQTTNHVVVHIYNGDEIIKTQQFTDVLHLTMFIYQGNKFSIESWDEGGFTYTYTMYNSDESVQLTEFIEGVGHNMINRNFQIQ